MELTNVERETVIAFAKCNMNVSEAAKKLFLSRNAVDYRLLKIKERTGFDPKDFFHLMDLVQFALSI